MFFHVRKPEENNTIIKTITFDIELTQTVVFSANEKLPLYSINIFGSIFVDQFMKIFPELVRNILEKLMLWRKRSL